MKLLQRWKMTSIANQLLAVATVVMAFGTLFYVGVAVSQYCLMKSGARETANQVNKVITEARRIADSTEKTFAQSKAALDASIEISRNDQRAWVGPIEVTLPQFSDGSHAVYLKEGSQATIGVTITNSGKTPARKFMPRIQMGVLRTGKPFIPEYPALSTRQSVAVVHPGMKPILYAPPFGPPKQLIDAIAGGQYVLYLYGIMTYEDIYNRPHKTTFCMFIVSWKKI
jgi:cell division protein FtsI/penicillin-binding protein 2